MSLNRNSLAALLAGGEPLVIHHWDADGVTSAVTIAQFVGRGVSFLVPPFTYRPKADFMNVVAGLSADKDLVLVVDYNVQPEVYASIVAAAAGKPVVVIDHHVSAYPRVANFYYYNPAAEGDPMGLWPSAAHVIADALGFYDPMLIAVSIYGDLWEEALNNRVYRAYMNELGLDVERDSGLIRECAMQLWASEAARLTDVIGGLAYSLAYGGVDPCQAILSDPRMTNAREAVEADMKRAINDAERGEALGGRVMIYGIKASYRVTGMIARQLARQNPGKAVVVYSLEGGVGKVYVRGLRDSRPLIERLRSKGLSAGGKSQLGNNVISLEVPQESLDVTVKEVIRSMEELAGSILLA
ncbi:MAG: DHH family phosphoesterase [Acidilobus sp.]